MKKIFLFLLTFFYLFLLFAETSVTAYVEERKIGINDLLKFTIEISDDSDKNIKQPSLPDIPGFDYLSTSSSHSSSMQIINGRMTSSVTQAFTYSLRPKRIGKFIIPPISIKMNRKKYVTDAISVEVVQGSTQKLPPSNRYRDQSQASSADVEDNLFIVAEVSKRDVFKGEPIKVDYKIYSRYNIANLEFTDEPQFNGFWKEVISRAEYKNFTRARYKGQIFNMMPLLSVALFPSSTGKLEIPEINMTVDVRVEPRSFFDFGSTKRFSIGSKSVSVNVKDIPATNKPVNFSGAIGRFTVKSSISQTELKVGDTFTYTLEISGTGNISQFEQPKLPEMNHLRFLTPEITSDINADKISGLKTIKYLVIAQEKGTFTIPSLEFAYFDTQKKQYEVLKTKSYTINVEEGDGLYIPSSMAQSSIRAEAKDIRFILTDIVLKRHRLLYKSFLYWFVWILGLISIPVSLLIVKEKTKLADDVDYIRQKQAAKIIKKYLKEAANAVKENKLEFYSFAQNGLSSYLSDKLKIARGSTTETIIESMYSKQLDTQLITEIESFLVRCNQARFMPGGFSNDSIHDDFSNLKTIVQKISKVL